MWEWLLDTSKVAPVLNTFGIIGLYAILGTGLMLAAIKIAPRWRQQTIDRDESDTNRFEGRLDAVERELKIAVTAAHNAEMRLVYAVNAVQLLAVRYRKEWPDDPALMQAMELLKAATTGSLESFAFRLQTGIDAAS